MAQLCESGMLRMGPVLNHALAVSAVVSKELVVLVLSAGLLSSGEMC